MGLGDRLASTPFLARQLPQESGRGPRSPTREMMAQRHHLHRNCSVGAVSPRPARGKDNYFIIIIPSGVPLTHWPHTSIALSGYLLSSTKLTGTSVQRRGMFETQPHVPSGGGTPKVRCFQPFWSHSRTNLPNDSPLASGLSNTGDRVTWGDNNTYCG